MVACSSCGPAELETTETAEEVEEDPYPFATWESCSQSEGDHPCNFTLLDQSDEEVFIIRLLWKCHCSRLQRNVV